MNKHLRFVPQDAIRVGLQSYFEASELSVIHSLQMDTVSSHVHHGNRGTSPHVHGIELVDGDLSSTGLLTPFLSAS